MLGLHLTGTLGPGQGDDPDPRGVRADVLAQLLGLQLIQVRSKVQHRLHLRRIHAQQGDPVPATLHVHVEEQDAAARLLQQGQGGVDREGGAPDAVPGAAHRDDARGRGHAYCLTSSRLNWSLMSRLA